MAVGQLKRARGNRGEFLAEIYSSDPGRASGLREVRLEKDRNSRIATVESVWYHGGRPILKFAGIDSISQAEEWQGADILVPEDERVRPSQGEYTHADLIGCRVLRDDTEDQVGVIRGVEEYGASVLLDVEPPGGGEILVPFAREICREIDVGQKLIRVWLPPGL